MLGEPFELAQWSLRLAVVVAGDDQLAAEQIRVDRLEHGACAAHAGGARGKHPRDVRGVRERDLVWLAGQRAAVDHRQRVALAGVIEQQLDPLARALGREPRAGREHPHPASVVATSCPAGSPATTWVATSVSDRGASTPA